MVTRLWNDTWTAYQLRNATYEDTPTFSLSGIRCKGRVVRVYDGDTLWLAIPYPDNKVFKYRVRLHGYDAPELHPRSDAENRDQLVQAALNAKAFLEQTLARSNLVDAEFFEYDKYGRPLVKLTLPGETQTINDLMVAKRFGYAYQGKTKLNPAEQLAQLNHSEPTEKEQQ